MNYKIRSIRADEWAAAKELRNPSTLFRGGDTLYVGDWGLRRTSRWTLDGRFAGAVPASDAMRGVLAEREVVLREVRVHELLQRALAVRAVAPHGERHEPPAERLGQVIRGELALEETRWEVPQRALAPLGLVDGQRARAVEHDLDEERRVGAAGQPPLEGHLAACEERGEIRR